MKFCYSGLYPEERNLISKDFEKLNSIHTIDSRLLKTTEAIIYKSKDSQKYKIAIERGLKTFNWRNWRRFMNSKQDESILDFQDLNLNKLNANSKSIHNVKEQWNDNLEILENVFIEEHSLRNIKDNIFCAISIDSSIDVENLPESEQPSSIKTKLLTYQKQGLQWLYAHENPILPSLGTDPFQLWEARLNSSGSITYINILSKKVNNEPFLAKGGILADDMGLGKTIQCISLITSTIENSTRTEVKKPSLIICPLSIIGNWETQFRTHTNNLNKFDVIITTYDTVRYEWMNRKKDELFDIIWKRIILDEGHLIKTTKSQTSKAVCDLQSEIKWILSGTPIQNERNDLFGLIKFLNIPPLNDYDYWKVFVKNENNVNYILHSLLKSITLRRTKGMSLKGKPLFELPPIDYFINEITFNEQEEELYRAFEDETRAKFAQYDREGTVLQNYHHILEIMTRLRQVCDHVDLIKDRKPRIRILPNSSWASRYADINEEEQLKLIQILKDNEEEDCCICLCTIKFEAVIIRNCLHFFCKSCIYPVVKENKSCPMCRGPLTFQNLVDRPEPEEEIEIVEPSVKSENISNLVSKSKTSSKIEALIKYLLATERKDSNIKSVIFSQWTTMLDRVEIQLKNADIKYLRFDGKMSRTDRQLSIEKFQKESGCRETVMLCSLKAAALGLTLTRASQVFLLDPWWNPTVEDQAIDRVYRLGQTRNVKVIRMVIKNTIEERVIELQKEKKQLLTNFFDHSQTVPHYNQGNIRKTRIGDLRRLLLGKEKEISTNENYIVGKKRVKLTFFGRAKFESSSEPDTDNE